MKFPNTYHGGNPYNRVSSADFERDEDISAPLMMFMVFMFAISVCWMVLS